MLGDVVANEDATVAEARQEFEGELAKAKMIAATCKRGHGDIIERRSSVSRRVLGHVVHAPPISLGTSPKQFTGD